MKKFRTFQGNGIYIVAKKYIRNLKIFKRNIRRQKNIFNQSFAQIKVND